MGQDDLWEQIIHYQYRADQALALASEMDGEPRLLMLRVAQEYEAHAEAARKKSPAGLGAAGEASYAIKPLRVGSMKVL
jgi:hypothetical protein